MVRSGIVRRDGRDRLDIQKTGILRGRQDPGSDRVIELAERVVEYVPHQGKERHPNDGVVSIVASVDRRNRQVDRLRGDDRERAGRGRVEPAAVVDGDTAFERDQAERGRQQQAAHGRIWRSCHASDSLAAGRLAETDQGRLRHQRIETQRAAGRLHRHTAIGAHAGDIGHEIVEQRRDPLHTLIGGHRRVAHSEEHVRRPQIGRIIDTADVDRLPGLDRDGPVLHREQRLHGKWLVSRHR